MPRAFLFVMLLMLAGCSLPRIVVLNDPLDASQHNDLGVAYEARGEYDLAVREYRRAAELDQEWARPLINRGNALARQAAWDEAAASYREALRRDPGNSEAMNNLAWVLLQGGEEIEALAWAEKATANAADHPAYLDTLAATQLANGQKKAAAETVRRALVLAPAPELRGALQEKLETAESPNRDPAP